MAHLNKIDGVYEILCHSNKFFKSEYFYITTENDETVKMFAKKNANDPDKEWAANSKIGAGTQFPVSLKYKYEDTPTHPGAGQLFIAPIVKKSKVFIYGECHSNSRVRPFCYVLQRVTESKGK